jgi:hypothetical protein
MAIDSIIANALVKSPSRREKVYCDKWIHEGTCAFTQMGCKYKHVMPTDKATQMSLGLNHGFPTWYRRANHDLLNSVPSAGTIQPAATAVTTGHSTHETSRARIDENWRGGSARGHCNDNKSGGGVNGKTSSKTHAGTPSESLI